jgi:hypothetical protein
MIVSFNFNDSTLKIGAPAGDQLCKYSKRQIKEIQRDNIEIVW